MNKALVAEDGIIRIIEVAVPRELPNKHILVKIRAAGVNRADILQVKGRYQPPAGASNILGLEFSGEAVRCGNGCSRIKEGFRVCGLTSAGAYAEHIVIPEDLLIKLSDNLGYEEGAAITESWGTAYFNLIEKGKFVEGETSLIHSAGGGVGLAGIQILRERRAAKIVASVGSPEKNKLVLDAGASEIFNYRERSYEELAENSENNIDLILDTVGARALSAHLKLCRHNARIVLIGLLGGQLSELNLGMVLQKNITLIGSTLRPQPLEVKAHLIECLTSEIMPSFDTGKFKVHLDKVFPFTEVDAAHAYILGNRNIGNVVLRW